VQERKKEKKKVNGERCGGPCFLTGPAVFEIRPQELIEISNSDEGNRKKGRKKKKGITPVAGLW